MLLAGFLEVTTNDPFDLTMVSIPILVDEFIFIGEQNILELVVTKVFDIVTVPETRVEDPVG